MPNLRTTSLLRSLGLALLTSSLIGSSVLAGSTPATAAPDPEPASADRSRGVATGSTARHGRATVPTLVKRATLSADYYIAPGPPSDAKATQANGRTEPFPGQIIPGSSGMVDNGDGTFWAMPDNGFGAKNNSADFLLRLYLVKPRWETARGGPGAIAVRKFISLRDPNRLLDFPIVSDDTPPRLLTGTDFDIESVVRNDDGTLWIGEEFGPFLLHVDAAGTLLSKPVRFRAESRQGTPT